jgi:hypothetical protein
MNLLAGLHARHEYYRNQEVSIGAQADRYPVRRRPRL